MYMKALLFLIIYVLKLIKSDDQLKDNQSLRFLTDKKSPKLAYSKFQYESEEYNLLDRIREISPFELFSKISAEEENKSFNVRCFWVDLETLRVYDLIKLKTKK